MSEAILDSESTAVVEAFEELDSAAVDADAMEWEVEAAEQVDQAEQVDHPEQPAPAADATPVPASDGEGEPEGEPEEQASTEPVESQPQSPGLSLAQQVEAMERQVADESVELAELDAQRAELKKRLKVSVELLVDLRAKIEAKTSGESKTSELATATAATGQAETATSAPSPATQQVDPATITPLEKLGITPGRLENLKATEATPGRNCTTIADLERLIREGRLQHVRGFGEKAIDAVTDALMGWRAANPVPSVESVDVPESSPAEDATPQESGSIKIPDDIAKSREDSNEYRAGAQAALAGQKVTSNPHRQGSHAWGMWDRGWQENFPGDDSE